MDMFSSFPVRIREKTVHEIEDGSMGLFVKAVCERENKIELSKEITPASLRLKGLQYLLKNSKRVVKYNDI